jgi:hypothetical protein
MVLKPPSQSLKGFGASSSTISRCHEASFSGQEKAGEIKNIFADDNQKPKTIFARYYDPSSKRPQREVGFLNGTHRIFDFVL